MAEKAAEVLKEAERQSLARWWRSKDLLARIVAVVAIALCLYDLLFILGLYPRLGIYIMLQPHQGMNLAAIMLMTFLLYAPRKSRNGGRVPWYDIVLLLMGVVPSGYYFFFQDLVLRHLTMGEASTLEIAFFFMLTISLLEAGRRVAGWAMSLISLFFIFHAFFSDLFPGFLFSRPYSLPRLVTGFYSGAEGIFGVPMAVSSITIITFVVFAYFLLYSGAGKFFIDLALSIMGTVRGGPAKAAVVASALFGTISGSTSANVAACGSVTIPLMKKIGYEPEFAGGVEAVASNGGQIMPPVMGAVAFVMAEMTGIPYIQICAASLLPAILYYCGLFGQIDLEAVRLGLKGLPREELPSTKETLKRGWHYLVPLAALILFMTVLNFTAEKAALYSMGLVILASWVNRESRMGPYRIIAALEGAGKSMCVVAVTCAASGIIIGSLAISGVGSNLAMGIVDMSGGNIYILAVLTGLTCFILGTGMGAIAVYLMLAVLVAPALLEVHVPVMAAHLFIVYWGIVSYITPPVAVAAYVAAGISGGDPNKTGWVATRLGVATYIIPFMFVFNPVLLMIGQPAEIGLAIVTSITGMLLLAVGVSGRFYIDFGRLSLWERTMFAVGAILLIIPGWTMDIAGAAIVIPVMLWRLVRSRRNRAAVMAGVMPTKDAVAWRRQEPGKVDGLPPIAGS